MCERLQGGRGRWRGTLTSYIAACVARCKLASSSRHVGELHARWACRDRLQKLEVNSAPSEGSCRHPCGVVLFRLKKQPTSYRGRRLWNEMRGRNPPGRTEGVPRGVPNVCIIGWLGAFFARPNPSEQISADSRVSSSDGHGIPERAVGRVVYECCVIRCG